MGTQDHLERLHDRKPVGAFTVLYPPKPGMAEEAANHWKHTGVCPDCAHRSVTGGRCIMCGWKAKEE